MCGQEQDEGPPADVSGGDHGPGRDAARTGQDGERRPGASRPRRVAGADTVILYPQSASLRTISTRFINTTSMLEVGEALADALSRLAIPSCFVALEDPEGGYRGAIEVSERGLSLDIEGRFSSERLVPESLLASNRRATWLLEPLVVQQRRLGYVMFETGALEGRVYVCLRDQLSAAIAGVSATG